MADIQIVAEVVGANDVEKLTNKIDDFKRRSQFATQASVKQARATRNTQAIFKDYGVAVRSTTGEVLRYKDVLQKATVDQNQFGTLASKGVRQFKRFGAVGMQQVGYQVGDFAVQVQSGTNAMVAFGQQGSQLAGIFGPGGAVIGALIAIGTAAGNVFLNMAENAKKSKTDIQAAFSSLGSAVENLEEAQNKYNKALELSQMLSSGLSATGLSSVEEELSARRALLNVEQARFRLKREQLRQEIEGRQQIIENLTSQTTIDTSTERGRRERVAELRRIIDSNQEIFLSQREQKAELQLIDALLDQTSEGVNETLEGTKSTTLEFSKLTGSAQNLVDKFSRLLPEVSPVQAKLLEMNQTMSDMTGINLAGVFQSAKSFATDLLNETNAAADAASRFSENLALGQDFLNAKVRAGVEAGTIPPQALEDLPPTAAESAYQNFLDAKRRQARSGSSSEGGGSVSQTTNQVKDLTNALKEQETVLQSVGKTMASSFGDALMGIVDGTKSAADAFKDMARQILKQAFDMLVVKPIMDSIMGAFGVSTGGLGMSQSNASALVSQTITALAADGGAWNNGVQMYANGGVVGSPTAFQHKGGLGVMGEAGPEAIMPLKRGKNGKLGVQSEGGQQPVVIHQNFNFSANGDDSVKRIIQQEAPKIANYTQQQILDQRRRGGAMKSTFGG